MPEAGIDMGFLQDNHSLSRTLRGLHFQTSIHAQAKLVCYWREALYDVDLDIRNASPTDSQWVDCELDAENGMQLAITAGFANSVTTLQTGREIIYKCLGYDAPESEGALRWDDPSIGINGPCRPMRPSKPKTHWCRPSPISTACFTLKDKNA